MGLWWHPDFCFNPFSIQNITQRHVKNYQNQLQQLNGEVPSQSWAAAAVTSTCMLKICSWNLCLCFEAGGLPACWHQDLLGSTEPFPGWELRCCWHYVWRPEAIRICVLPAHISNTCCLAQFNKCNKSTYLWVCFGRHKLTTVCVKIYTVQESTPDDYSQNPVVCGFRVVLHKLHAKESYRSKQGIYNPFTWFNQK